MKRFFRSSLPRLPTITELTARNRVLPRHSLISSLPSLQLPTLRKLPFTDRNQFSIHPESDMNRLLLACSALFIVPVLSGCCSCSPCVDPCAQIYQGSCNNYSGCVPTAAARPTSHGRCNNCQSDNFALPPVDGSISSYPGTQSYPSGQPFPAGQPYPGQTFSSETWGPEVVGPEYVPGGNTWSNQVAPPVPTSPTPAAPHSHGSSGIPNVLAPPAPIPAISPNNNVIPPPSPYPASSQSGGSVGPMVPQVPPPPAEPISQMQYRRYR